MGMFDELTCKYPLPVAGTNNLQYQTKSLDCELDNFEIREDGSLWREAYEVEDRSDPNAEGLMRLVGCMTRINEHWIEWPHTGEVRFYTALGEREKSGSSGWIEYVAYFVDGKLKELNLISHRPEKT